MSTTIKKKSSRRRRDRAPDPNSMGPSRGIGYDSSSEARVGTTAPLYVRKEYRGDNISVAGPSGTGFAFTFLPNSLPGWASYATLYARFRMNKVTVRIEPLWNNATLSAAVTAGTPVFAQYIHSTVDYLTGTAPSSAASLYNDLRYKRTKETQDHVRSFVPMLQMDVASSTLLDTDTTLVNPWMSTADTYDAYFLGMRVYLDPISSAAITTPAYFAVWVTLDMAFRDPIV